LNIKYEKGKIDILEYRKMAKVWNEIYNKYGYPEIPYDSTNSNFRYEFIYSFDSISKNIIYNRILENVSMKNYHLADVLDYQDYELGKIILTTTNNGKFSDNNGTITYNCKYRFTVIENKVKVEVFKIRYNHSSFGTYPIEQLYPITKMKAGVWKSRFILLIAIDKDIRETVLNILHYIKNYQQDYNF
jgi:hypothetical protein